MTELKIQWRKKEKEKKSKKKLEKSSKERKKIKERKIKCCLGPTNRKWFGAISLSIDQLIRNTGNERHLVSFDHFSDLRIICAILEYYFLKMLPFLLTDSVATSKTNKPEFQNAIRSENSDVVQINNRQTCCTFNKFDNRNFFLNKFYNIVSIWIKCALRPRL